jgi:hypothetical protein
MADSVFAASTQLPPEPFDLLLFRQTNDVWARLSVLLT